MSKGYLQYRNHYVRDWETSETVRLMSYAARGIYQALLDAQWETGSIPADAETCAQLLRCTPEEWAQFDKFFDKCFPLVGDERRANARMAEDREGAAQLVEKARAAAKAGVEKRRLNSNEPVAERPLSDRRATAERPLSPTTTTTTTTTAIDTVESIPLTKVSGAKGKALEGDEVPQGTPFLPETEPAAGVARLMLEVAKATNGPPPTRRMVLRYLGDSSPVRGLIEAYGEKNATRLCVWCHLYKPKLGYAGIFSGVQALVQEAKAANWDDPSRGKGKSKDDDYERPPVWQPGVSA